MQSPSKEQIESFDVVMIDRMTLELLILAAENWACNCEINGEGPNNPAYVTVRAAKEVIKNKGNFVNL